MNPLYDLLPNQWDWYDTVQILSLFQGAFILGLIVMVIYRYFTSGAPKSFYKTNHILSIVGSYVLLMLIVLRKVSIGVFTPSYPLWWSALGALFLAYLLADYSLLCMLSHLHRVYGHVEKRHDSATTQQSI